MFSMHKFANASGPHDSAAERGAVRFPPSSLLARSSLGFFTSKRSRPPLQHSGPPASGPFAKDIQIAPEKKRTVVEHSGPTLDDRRCRISAAQWGILGCKMIALFVRSSFVSILVFVCTVL